MILHNVAFFSNSERQLLDLIKYSKKCKTLLENRKNIFYINIGFITPDFDSLQNKP